MNIVITGASGGIGFQTAIYLASKSKNHIFAVSRDKKGLHKLQTQFDMLKEKGRLTIIVGDVSNKDFLIELIGEVSKLTNSLQAIINNAGMLYYKPFEELTDKEWESMYNVNLFSPVRLIKALIPLLKQSEEMLNTKFRAHIVNIGSIGGVMGSVKFSGLSAYSSSKGALSILSECLAEEFEPLGISVNCLSLGSVETEMFRKAFPGIKASMGPEQMGHYIGDFTESGFCFFNGKVLPVSISTP